MRNFGIVILLFALLGCATKPIVDFASPASVSIRYDKMLVSPHSASAGKGEGHKV